MISQELLVMLLGVLVCKTIFEIRNKQKIRNKRCV